jgi:hypothetical protein
MKALVALALVMFVTSALAFNNWYAVVIYDYDNKRAILGPFSSANVWHAVCGTPPHDRFSAAHQYQRVRAVHRFMASFGGLGIHIKGDTIVVSDVLTNSYFVYPINKEASNDPS